MYPRTTRMTAINRYVKVILVTRNIVAFRRSVRWVKLTMIRITGEHLPQLFRHFTNNSTKYWLTNSITHEHT
jgi:hypothetical protein